MNYDDVLCRLKALSGIPDDEASELSFLVYESMDEISQMLISDSDNESNCRRITAAAAALANYRYKKLLASRGDYDGIKAGDVTINSGGMSVSAAYEIYADRLAKIADIVKDSGDGFVFERTCRICTQEQ